MKPTVHLQGNSSTATKTLWLFPAGSGLATSYLALLDIDPDHVGVYGLNSPFVKQTEIVGKYCFEDLTAAYLTEMHRWQPNGPYLVGGWSAGGICAYNAAQKLIADGQDVEGLILLDSPNPIGLEKLSPRLYDEFNRLNLFALALVAAGRNPPSWLLLHFMGFSNILYTYSPRPWE